MENTPNPEVAPVPGTMPAPTPAQQARKAKNASWGAIISILIILGMVIMGAFYSWGQRIAENPQTTPTVSH